MAPAVSLFLAILLVTGVSTLDFEAFRPDVLRAPTVASSPGLPVAPATKVFRLASVVLTLPRPAALLGTPPPQASLARMAVEPRRGVVAFHPKRPVPRFASSESPVPH